MLIGDTGNPVGLAWYTPEAWKRLAAIPEARIQKSYRAFVQACEAAERGFAAQGITTERVPVDVDQMLEWCHRHGYEIDDRGRAIFGTVLTMARDDLQVRDAPFVDSTRVLQ
jgi:hypothetical protein